MIAFNFQHTQYFNSAKHCISSIRKFYDDLPIDLYYDMTTPRINDYEKMADDYNCNFIFRDRVQGFMDRKHHIEDNIDKMLESHYRLYDTCRRYTHDWVILLEDDVYLRKRIEKFPNADCGKNRHDCGFLGGGSILNREAFLKIYEAETEDGLRKIIEESHMFSWAGDALKRHLFHKHGFSDEKWLELGEPGYFDGESCSVFHGYKDLHKLG
jgi:hypothetical protein